MITTRLLALAGALFSGSLLSAQSVWLASPGSNHFNTASNYSPAPNFGANPALSFANSSVTDLDVTNSVTLSSLTFPAGADAFIFSGSGVISITNATANNVVLANNSSATQIFENPLAVIGSANARWNAVAGDIVFAGGLIVNTANRNVFIGASTGFTFTVSGPVTGVAGIIKGANGLAANQGTLVLSNPDNTFQGPLTANAGPIVLLSTGADGASTGNLNVGNTAGGDNASILIGAAGVTVARNITVQSGSSGTMRVGGTADFTSGAGIFSGNLTLGSSGNGKAATLEVAGAAEITYSGVIQDVAGLSASFPAVTKAGSGVAILGGASTFQGNLVINAGTVRLGAAERLRDSITVQLAGGTFATGGFSETIGTLHLTANATLNFGSGASVLTLNALTRTAGTLQISNWSGNAAGGGTDRLIVAETPAASTLAALHFAGYTAGAAALPLEGGGFELVPDTGLATPPVITAQPSPVTVPQGSSPQLSVTAVGSGTLSYQWRRNEENLSNSASITGANTATLTLVAATGAASGSYDVVVSNEEGSTTSDAVAVVIYGAPVITAEPQSITRDLGQSASFSVEATSAVTPTYQWRKGGQPIAGATAAQFGRQVVTSDDAGDYDVVVTNGAGFVTSAVATLTISDNPVAPVILSPPTGRTANAGENVTFSVAAVGTTPLAYQWRRNGTPINGATAPSLTLNAVTTNAAGSYDVVVSNDYGSATSAAANLIVLAGQTPVSAWRQMHPGGGGQVQGLSFDPNLPGRLYECSDVEGAYRSDDWGLTWIPIAEDLIHHMSFHIAVTPGDSNVIYCGTLYGIHKSTDAGRTWELILGGYSNASWAFDPFDPTGKTWIAGRSWYIKNSQLPSQTFHPSQQTSGAFFVVRSTDAGETLTQHHYREGSGTNQVYTITYDPTRQGHVYIAGDAGLFRSRDGGETWESIALPTGTLTRGADITPDGKWLYVTVGTAGTLHVAAVNPTSAAFTWTNVHTNTTLLSAAGGNYWRPLVDPRSAIPAEQGGLGVDQHRVIMGSFTSSANSNVGLVEGEFTDSGGTVTVNGWDYAFRRAGTAPGWDYEFGWNLIDPQCRQYAWMPRSWDNATPPEHISVIDSTTRRSRILMASQQSVYLGSPDDPNSWNVLSSGFVRAQSTGGSGTARFYRTRGFSSTVNFDMDGWETYYAQGMADNKVLESFDGGYSWTQDTVPGGRVGNGDAVLILRPRTAGEIPVSLIGTAPGAGGGSDTAVGTLYRKTLTNLTAPTDPWVNLGALPLQGLSTAPRIWYMEANPANNDRVFIGTEAGLYYTDSMREATPSFTRVTNITDSFKQGRIFVDPLSTDTNVVLYFKNSGAARLYTAVGTRASTAEPFTFTYTSMPTNGTIRVIDDFSYWRRASDQREFMAHTNNAQELWIRERALGDTNWTAWTRVVNRAGVLAVKTLPWIDWIGRGVDLATQQIIPNLSSAPDAFTISGLGGHENSLIAAAWVEDGKHGYAMLRLDRNGLGDWTLSDWTGEPVPGSFDYHMGVARVWRSKVVAVTPDRHDFLTASRGGGLWAREVGEPAADAPTITSGNTAHGVVNGSFSYAITTSPVATSYAVTGTLPTGITLNTSTGVLAGTPTTAGTFSVTLTASNVHGTSEPLVLEIVIAPAEATVSLTDLDVPFDGSPKAASVQTTPAGLSVSVSYNGSATAPTAPGSYTVLATITDPNYVGSTSGTLIIRSLLAQWRAEKFGSYEETAVSANTADPDGDGYVNLVEYALGLEPQASDAQGGTAVSTEAGHLVFTFLRARADLTYIVEGSANLVDWSVLATNPGTVGQQVSVTDVASLTVGPRFLRLRVQP